MTEQRALISLRSLVLEDQALLLRWRNQPEVAAQMYTDHTISTSEHERWFELATSDAPDRLYRVVEAGPDPIGLVSLTDIRLGTCTWGGYIGDFDWHGRGAGTAALWLSLDEAFARLQLERVLVEVLTSNSRAAELYERFGFEEQDDFHKVVLKSGRYCDVAGLALSRERWAATGPAVQRFLRQRGLIS